MSLPLPRPTVIPYVTLRDGEKELLPKIGVRSGGSICYLDEVPGDRDAHGVLWARYTINRGGAPKFSRVHPRRQRRVMSRLLCQVCAKPADRDEQGVLWLIEDYRGEWADWPEGFVTGHPPLCLPCARLSIAQCHNWLREKWVAVRVRTPVISGVHGTYYHRQGGPLTPEDGRAVLYADEADAAWVLARQMLATLHDCTLVDLAPAGS